MPVPVASDDVALGADFTWEYTDANFLNRWVEGEQVAQQLGFLTYVGSATYGTGTGFSIQTLAQCYAWNNAPGQMANIGQYRQLIDQPISGSGILTFVQGTKAMWSTIGTQSQTCGFRTGAFPVVEQGYISWCLLGVPGEVVKVLSLDGSLNADDGELLDGLYYNLNPGVSLQMQIFTAVGAPIVQSYTYGANFGYNNS
jgi:hypothetical protein